MQRRPESALRPRDTVARLGGDEFAVVLHDVRDLADALAVTERVRGRLELPVEVHDVLLELEASIGVVLSGEHGDDVATLLQRADVAMYAAKQSGRRTCAYQPELDGNSRDRLALLGELRRALQAREVELHFQPKVGVVSRELVGVEALVRWRHPERGVVPPLEFVPLAERTGLIGPLTHFVLDRALAQCRAWLDAGRRVPVAVNLSARTLLDEHLADDVAGLLARWSVPAELLTLEITESAVMLDADRARAVLREVVAQGVTVAVDDFGAGYTSLGQLQELPVGELKIDRSIVGRLAHDRDAQLVVRALTDLGHHLGLVVVGEGVEDEDVLQRLAEVGCDVAQGYHLGRPLPAAELDGRLADRDACRPDAQRV